MKLQNTNIKPWVDFYDKGVPKTFKYPNKMLWEFMLENIDKYPNSPAYEYYGTKVSFKKFKLEIEEAARGLKELGVKKDDIVTIISPNIPEAIILFYAINMVGAVSNMIHPLSAVKEIENYLCMTNSKYVFTIDVTLDKVLEIRSNTFIDKIVVMSPSNKMNKIVKTVYNLTQKKVKVPYEKDFIISWNDFIDFGYLYDGKFIYKRDTDDPAVIMFSGGTSGKPKGIILSNKNFNAPTMQTGSMIEPAGPGDSILTIMPVFHAFGLDVCIHTPLSKGVKCTLIPIFNYKKFARLIKQYKPNFVVGVPSLLETMINDESIKDMDLSFVKDIIVGGDVLTDQLKKSVDKFMKSHGSNATARVGYGLTEGSGPSTLMPRKIQPKESIGIPCQDMNYRIINPETLEVLGANEVGEIIISGPNVMIGYLNDPEENKKVFLKDKKNLWLRTGDMGKMDENGFVYFSQRLKRIIVSSGYNVYPSQIESVISKHPLVKEVCVVSKPHPYKMYVAKAFITLNKDVIFKDKVKKEIKDLCKEYLPKYSLPYEYEFRDELPRTNIGKIAYKTLEEEEKNKELKKDV